MRAAMAKDSMEKFGPKYAKTLMPQPGDRLVELAYVNEMIAAVKNKEGILDNPDKKGQSQGMKFVDGLDDVTIRMKCFELYVSTRLRLDYTVLFAHESKQFKACDAYQGIKLTPEYHNVTKRQEVAVKDFDGYIQKIIHGLKVRLSSIK
jgi:hypothetical protein